MFSGSFKVMSTEVSAIRFAPRESSETVEQGLGFAPKFDEHGLIPAIATDHRTNEVLMVAYMNEESLKQTLTTGHAVYWSRSRKKLWHKGETSGEFQVVKEIRVDCDQDALVLKVDQLGGGCCHTKRPTCFYRKVELAGAAEGAVVAEAGEVQLVLDTPAHAS